MTSVFVAVPFLVKGFQFRLKGWLIFPAVSFLSDCHLVILLSINSPTRKQKQIKKVLLWKSEVSHLRLTQPPYLTAVCSWRSHLISLGLIFLAFKIKVKILYHRVLLGLNCRGALETERESKYVTISGLN